MSEGLHIPKIPAGSSVRPSLEYLHQYKVVSVSSLPEGGWMIEFDNGSNVENHEIGLASPEGLEGLSLVTTVYAADETVLHFGRVKVNKATNTPEVVDGVAVRLEPTQYRVVDPRFEEAAFPQRTEQAEGDDVGTDPQGTE